MDESGTLTPPVIEIMTLMSGSSQYSDLQAASVYAEQHLARPRHAERTDARSTAHYDHVLKILSQEQLVKLDGAFRALGWLEEMMPPHATIDYVLINGGTVPSMRSRVMAVARAVKNGTLDLSDDAAVIFLDGERPLFVEETEHVLKSPAP